MKKLMMGIFCAVSILKADISVINRTDRPMYVRASRDNGNQHIIFELKPRNKVMQNGQEKKFCKEGDYHYFHGESHCTSGFYHRYIFDEKTFPLNIGPTLEFSFQQDFKKRFATLIINFDSMIHIDMNDEVPLFDIRIPKS